MTYAPQSTLIGTYDQDDPSSTADSASGFRVGSVWVNTRTLHAWVCTDATAGSATWGDLGTVDATLVEDFTTLRNNFRRLLLLLAEQDFDLPDDLLQEADLAEEVD
jgi:hypothetical protein